MCRRFESCPGSQQLFSRDFLVPVFLYREAAVVRRCKMGRHMATYSDDWDARSQGSPRSRRPRPSYDSRSYGSSGSRTGGSRSRRPHSGSSRRSSQRIPQSRGSQLHRSSAQGYRRSSQQLPRGGQLRQPPRRGLGPLPLIIGAVVLVLLLGFGIFWCTSRVKVTVNGSELTVGRGTSVQKVVEQSPAEKTPGDFVTVSGNVIEAGKGEAFTATVNGSQMSAQQAADVQIEGGESIEVSRGADITEEYDAEPMQTMPKLVIDGDSYIMGYLYQWGRPGVTEKRTGKVSGEIASVVTQEVQDCIVRERRPQPANDEKIVALTFDDGPSKYTQQFLDILDKYEVKATFFNLGENIDQYPELAKKVVEKGHQLASHTYNHKQLNKLDAAEFIKQVDENAKRIEEATGVYTSFIRAPYGEFSAECWLNSKGSITAAVNWTEDSEDWELPGVDAIVEKAAGDVNPGSIILMHDGGGEREQGIEALPQIIEKLQAKGYRFVTLDELFASDPEIPNDVCNSKVKMPDWAVWPTELAKTTPTTSAANGASTSNANGANASSSGNAATNAGSSNANASTGSTGNASTSGNANATTGSASSTSGSSTAKTGAATSSQQQPTTQKSSS